MNAEDLLATLILGSFGVGGLWLLWASFISEFPNAGIWNRRRQRFLQEAERLGFLVEPGETAVKKQVGDLVIVARIVTVCGKSKSIHLRGKVELPDFPPGLEISQESLAAVSRTFGAKERTTGDPEFDAVFWLQCGSEEAMRDFLTPTRRQALLRHMVGIPRALIREGGVLVDIPFSTPQAMVESTFSKVLGGLECLACELQGETVENHEPNALTPREAKLRRFGRNGTLLWGLPACLALYVLATGTAASPFLAVVALWPVAMVGLHVGLYRGSLVSRVLLQGVYACLALVFGIGLVLGLLEASDVLNLPGVRVSEDDVMPLVLAGGLGTVGFWSCRHYLKALDTSLAEHRGA